MHREYIKWRLNGFGFKFCLQDRSNEWKPRIAFHKSFQWIESANRINESNPWNELNPNATTFSTFSSKWQDRSEVSLLGFFAGIIFIGLSTFVRVPAQNGPDVLTPPVYVNFLKPVGVLGLAMWLVQDFHWVLSHFLSWLGYLQFPGSREKLHVFGLRLLKLFSGSFRSTC